MITISHSQAEAFLQCEMKYKFAHIDQLEPLQRSQALNIGIAGHEFFEAFFKAVKDGKSKEESVMAGQLAAMEEPQGLVAMSLAAKWVEEYWSGLVANWEILVVEETGRLNLGKEVQFPFTMDLIFRDKYDGKIYLMDHKFLGQFYSEEVMELMPQMPKYIAGAQLKHGITIDGAIYNLITTRANAREESLFKMYRMSISQARINEAMREQFNASQEIIKLHDGSKRPIRTINKMNCGHCPYKVLCKANIEKQDSDFEMNKELLFKKNTYGYEVEEDAINV